MKPNKADFFIGLDLGQKHDFSALAVLEKSSGAVPCYHLRHLERLKLNTPYPAVAQRAQSTGRLTGATMPNSSWTLTGVGAPVFDLLQAAGVNPVAITITGGHSVSETREHLHVPKRVLIRHAGSTLWGEQIDGSQLKKRQPGSTPRNRRAKTLDSRPISSRHFFSLRRLTS